MNIYHISYTERFVGERMASLSFKGCNFACKYCIRKKNEYDIYAEDRRYIEWTVENIIKELRKLRPHRIYLGGYEPTLDPDLEDIVCELSSLDAYIVLMTNGSMLNREYAERLIDAGVDEFIVSVKAFDDEKHVEYTGCSNNSVLDAIKMLTTIDKDFRLQVETELIPYFNEPEDIEELSRFIAAIDPSIPLFIEPLIPPSDDIAEPTKEDLINAVSAAMRHVFIVSYHPLPSEISVIRRSNRRAKFVEILPASETASENSA